MNEFNDNEIKDKPMFNADKFTYHEGKIEFYDFPCQVCSYYNNVFHLNLTIYIFIPII